MNNILILQWVQIILFILAVALAYFSLKIAIHSLSESKKARRDIFLPIIIIPENLSFSQAAYQYGGSLHLKNIGHGIARDVEATMTGIKKHFREKFIEISSDLDKYTWNISLKDTELVTKQLQKPEIVISYTDIFKRQIITKYCITQKELEGGTYKPSIDPSDFEITLPKG